MSAAHSLEQKEGWSHMSEDEAISWCRIWRFESDISYFAKWTPRVEGGNDEIVQPLTKAIELVWEQIKQARPPCLTGDGYPAIWFSSNPIAKPSSEYDLSEADRAQVVEYNASVHNPQLPTQIRIVDSSKQTEPRHTEPAREIALEVDKVRGRSEAQVGRLISSQIDFSGTWTKNEFCGGYWIHEVRKLEQRQRCPKCGEFGSGYGNIGNERRFYHERNRSCYLGVVENLLKRNPLVKCAKCGEMGREHKGKDGHTRVRHADRVCYVG